MKYIAIALAAAALSGCASIQNQAKLNELASMAAKVKSGVAYYCTIRPQTNLDDLALAAVSLATSERAADVIKASMDKVCEWVGEKPGPQQASQ